MEGIGFFTGFNQIEGMQQFWRKRSISYRRQVMVFAFVIDYADLGNGCSSSCTKCFFQGAGLMGFNNLFNTYRPLFYSNTPAFSAG